jgi:hypothetical protein
VIDLGADFRLNDKAEYQQWYKLEHMQDDLFVQQTQQFNACIACATDDAYFYFIHNLKFILFISKYLCV